MQPHVDFAERADGPCAGTGAIDVVAWVEMGDLLAPRYSATVMPNAADPAPNVRRAAFVGRADDSPVLRTPVMHKSSMRPPSHTPASLSDVYYT